jgi:LacI family transcriptional regulator
MKKFINSGRRATITDIAREVGVSTTTVINVLKGRGSEVSPPTSAKIMKVVKRVGYVKNLTASALASAPSKLIAVVLAGTFPADARQRCLEANPFYGDFILRLEHEARHRGYSINLYSGEEMEALPFLLQRNYDAVLVLGVSSPQLPRLIARHGVPQVLVDSFLPRGAFARVCGDEALGGRLAVDHLVARGCRKLAFVGDVQKAPAALIPNLRFGAARAASRTAGRPLTLFTTATSFDGGVAAAARVAASGCDGVVTAADVVAAGLVQGLRAAGVRVPQQVAVVGYDNLLVATLCLPKLTTVDQRLEEKIRVAMDWIQQPKPRAVVLIPPVLVVRESA